MKPLIPFALVAILCFAICSCGHDSRIRQDKKNALECAHQIMGGNYEAAVSYFDLQNAGLNADTLKMNLASIHDAIVKNFSANPTWNYAMTTPNQNKPSDFLFQFTDGKHFGYLEFNFLDNGKLKDIGLLHIIDAIPNMKRFWLLALIPLFILLFNLYTLLRVIRSKVKFKWLLVILILFLNVIIVVYNPLHGFQIEPFSSPILLGISFKLTAYSKTFWATAFPLGSLLATWFIMRSKRRLKSTISQHT